MKTTRIYGIMAEFDSASDLVAAASKTHESGYRKIDAYSPFPVEELARGDRVPYQPRWHWLRLIGGYHRRFDRIPDAVLDERSELSGDHRRANLLIHGQRSSSITFEMTILFGGISAVLGMLALNGLPMPYHPVFNVPRFAMAT